MGGYLGGDMGQIRDIVDLEPQDVEARDVEQLVDQPLQTADLVNEFGVTREFRENAHMDLQNRDRRAGVRGPHRR